MNPPKKLGNVPYIRVSLTPACFIRLIIAIGLVPAMKVFAGHLNYRVRVWLWNYLSD